MPSTSPTLNWNSLPDIRDVEPLDAVDEQCLADIEAVLVKHDRTNRFGVALLHKHFDVSPDEVMIERTYAQERRLVTEPVVADSATGDLLTTLWRFDGGVRYACSYCNKDHHTS